VKHLALPFSDEDRSRRRNYELRTLNGLRSHAPCSESDAAYM
jgi:hypothetical protein